MLWMILWVVGVVWLLHLAIPNNNMRHGRIDVGIYYAIWIFMLGTVLTIQYTILAQAGHALLAIASDGLALGVFVLSVLGKVLLQHRLGSQDAHSATVYPSGIHRPQR